LSIKEILLVFEECEIHIHCSWFIFSPLWYEMTLNRTVAVRSILYQYMLLSQGRRNIFNRMRLKPHPASSFRRLWLYRYLIKGNDKIFSVKFSFGKWFRLCKCFFVNMFPSSVDRIFRNELSTNPLKGFSLINVTLWLCWKEYSGIWTRKLVW